MLALVVLAIVGALQSMVHGVHGTSIQTTNNTLQFVVPANTPAEFVFVNEAGVPTGPPVPVASLADLMALQTQLLARINALDQSIESRVAAMVTASSTNPNALKTALDSKVSIANLAVIDAEVASVVTSMVAPGANNALAASLNSKLNASSTCQCFNPASLQSVNASLTTLTQQSAFFVDTRSLSTIDAEITSVVNSMVAPGAATNALATSLNGKLNASSTCQCFNPASLQSVNASLATLTQQSAFFVDTRSLTSIDAEITSVVNNMVAPGANNALAASLNGKLNASSTCQCFNPVSLQTVNASLVALTQQSAFFVDTRSLSSIDAEVTSVVNSMVAPNANNALATSLNGKLNASSTCQCFNPASLQSVNASVQTLAQQATFFVDTRSLSSIDAEITNVVNNMVAPGANNALATSLNGKLNASSTCQCFNPASLQSVNSSVQNLAQQATFFVDTRSLSSIDAEVTSVVNNMVAPGANNALATSLNGKLNASSTCQCFNPVSLQTVNSSLINLTQQSAFFVDTRSLSSINPQISTVVSQMAVAPPANNSLALQLSTKLTSAGTCQCFDPQTLVSLNTSLLSVVATQATLTSQVYVDTRNLSVLDAYVRNIVTSSVQCNSLPSAVANGNISLCFGTFNGFLCAPACNPGFRAVGNYSCVAGTWSGASQCVALPCPTLPSLTNGLINGTSSPITTGVTRTTVTFTCNTGYSLVGNVTATCQTNSTWSPSPVCQPLPCPTINAPTNGLINAALSTFTTGVTGSVVSFSCNAGYTLSGPSSATCQTNSQWTALPVCNALPCPTISKPIFVLINGVSADFTTGVTGTNVIFGCESGYTLTGATSATCQSSSTWSASPPTCRFAAVSGILVWVGPESTLTPATGPVQTWADMSGNGNNFVQNTGAQQPSVVASGINGLRSLRFTATNQQTILLNRNFPAPVSVFIVAKMVGGTNGRILSGINNNWLLGWWGGAQDQGYFEGWVTPTGTPTATTNPYLYEVIQTGSLSSVFRSGTQIASNNLGVAGPNGLNFAHMSTSEHSDCWVSELMVFGSALSAVDRGKVEYYLRTKYNV